MTVPRVPRRGESVHVDGHEGRFIVVRVDKVERIANLELWNDPAFELGAPFGAIHLIHQHMEAA